MINTAVLRKLVKKWSKTLISCSVYFPNQESLFKIHELESEDDRQYLATVFTWTDQEQEPSVQLANHLNAASPALYIKYHVSTILSIYQYCTLSPS